MNSHQASGIPDSPIDVNEKNFSKLEGVAPLDSASLNILHIAGTALFYYLTGKAALLLAVPPGYASPIWPAAGLALTCVLLFGRGVWPGIVIGHFLVNVGTSLDIATTDAMMKSVIIPVAIGIGGALQAILGSFLIRRNIGWPNPLVNEKEIFLFFLLGGPLACLVSSSIGVTILLIAGIASHDQIAANWLVWWLGDTLGVLLAPPLILVWLAKPEKLWGRRRKLLFLPIVGAMTASILLYLGVSQAEQARIETEYKNQALLITDAVKTNLNATVDISDVIVDFMQHSREVTREEFHFFVAPILARYPYIKAISWDPIVWPAARKGHEEQAHREGFPQYSITEKSENGSLLTAPHRDYYVPVFYIEPYVGNEPALGYNLASEPKRLEGLKRTMDTGHAAVSERIWLVQDTKTKYSVLFLKAVYGLGENEVTLKGYISVVLVVVDSVKAAMSGIIGEEHFITVKDLSAPEEEQTLVKFGGDSDTERAKADQASGKPHLGIFYRMAFDIAGRKWEILLSPTVRYLEKNYSWSTWASLSIGTLFSGLLSIFLLSVTGKAADLEQMVHDRTKEVVDLYNLAPCGYHSLDNNGVFVKINDTELQWLGYSREEVIGKMKATDLMTEESKEIFRLNFPKYLASGMINDLEFEFLRKDGRIINILLSGSAIRNEKGKITYSRSTLFDITSRKKGEEALQSINWLLKGESESRDISIKEKDFTPDYGDLTELNHNGEIKNSVDRNALYDISNTFIDLLGTSLAIYEANGDYALGIFSSNWCRFMDSAARKQCGAVDNRSALAQGKWLCHESCWSDASKVSIKECKPVDIECHGGLRLYALPIIADGECIGSINFGYGNPPTASDVLMILAEKYSIDIEELTRYAKEYKPRPPFMVELAKRRLHDSAKLIGNLVERKRVEKNLIITKFAVDHAYDSVFWVTQDGRFYDVNTSATNLLGYSREEMLNITIHDISPDFSPETWMEHWEEIKKRGSFTFETRGKKKNGHVFPVEVMVNHIRSGEQEYNCAFVRDITSRKEAEEKIRRSKESLAEAQRIANLGNWEVNIITGKTNWSDQMYRLLGFEVGEVAPSYEIIHNMVHPDDKGRLNQVYQKALNDGSPYVIEYRLTRKDGGLVVLRSEAYLQRYEAESPQKLLGITQDITETRFFEDALRKSAESLSHAQKIAHVGNWEWILDRNEFYWSDEIYRILGYQPKQFTPSYEDFIKHAHPEDIARVKHSYYKAIFELTHFNTEYRVVLSEHYEKHVHAQAEIEYDSNESPVRMVGTLQDITERKNNEEAIRAAEENNRMILESVVEGIYGLDIHGNCTFANPASLQILGYDNVNQLLGKHMHSLIHHTRNDGTSYPVDECHIYKAVRQREIAHVDNEILWRSDGTSFPAEYWSRPITSDGKTVGSVVTFINITERQRTTEKIIRAKEEAEEATKLKDKFVSLVSHDLKNPIGNIIGFLQLLQSIQDPPPNEKAVLIMDTALKSADNMVQLIDEILSLSRIGSGRIQPHFTFFDASILALRAFQKISFLAESKKIALNNNIPENTRIYADLELLEEVMHNLVTNAIKFSNKGDVISLFIPENEPTTIAVSDTGVGINPETIPDLFSYSKKTSTIGTSGERGTGYGLPLSQDIVKAHGGNLEVESQKGKGSTFFIKLPFIRPIVLLVDDDENTRALYSLHLKMLEADVIEAISGQKALEVLETVTPNLIITDIYMPEMDGFDLLARVRQHPKTSSIPVIVMTSEKELKIKERAFKLEANDFVQKTMDISDFIPRVRRYIG